MEKRVQVAFHYKIDPAKPGATQIPEQITRTISVGEDLVTEKVSSVCLSSMDRSAIMTLIEKQVQEATRAARPKGSATDSPATAGDDEEISAF